MAGASEIVSPLPRATGRDGEQDLASTILSIGKGRPAAGGRSSPGHGFPCVTVAPLLLLLLICGCGGGEGDRPASSGSVPRDGSVRILEEIPGSGPAAAPGDWVKVHYEGWVARNGGKGELFDSSRQRGEPLVLRLDERVVIPGWVEGMAGMRPGGRRAILVPPELAYGDHSAGTIPPWATLIFEIELLDLPRVAIEELAPGSGPAATLEDTLTVDYAGWVAEDGRKGAAFDPGSAGQEGPFRFILGRGQVIPGWELGLEGLRVGGRRRLTIPPELAYGSFGSIRAGEIVVPPGATLIYDIELTDLGRPVEGGGGRKDSRWRPASGEP